MGGRCDILNVEYLSDFVKGSTLRKISTFEKQGFEPNV